MQGHSYIYAKTEVRTFGPENIGKFYHSSDGILILCVQNVCVEAILISLNPILTEFVMIL